MAKKRKSARGQGIKIFHLKKKLITEITENTVDKLINELIEDTALGSLKTKLVTEIAKNTRDKLINELILEIAHETLKKSRPEFVPKNPNEIIFSNISALQK